MVISWCYSAFQEGTSNCVVWVHFHTHSPEYIDSIPNPLSAGEEALTAGNSNTSRATHLDCTPVQLLCTVASAAFGRAWYYSEEFLERPELSAMKLFGLKQYHLWLPSCPQTCWRPAAPGLPSAHPVSLLTLMGCVSMKQLTAATCPLFLASFISPRGN